MHTNQVESPGFVCLGHGDGLKNRKKNAIYAKWFIFSDPVTIINHIDT